MKVLWITNTLFEKHFDLVGLNNAPTGSGGWYKAAYDAIKEDPAIALHIVALSPRVREIVSCQDEHNNHFYVVPGSNTTDDRDFDSIGNRRYWQTIRDMAQPDIVQLWGTEYQHGLCALRVMQGIPQVVYIQGVLSEIARYYLAGIDKKVYQKHYTLRNLIKRDSSVNIQRAFFKRAEYEKDILRLAKNVIVENEWCEGICSNIIGQGANVYKSQLPINSSFMTTKWDLGDIEKYSVFTNAGGYNIKGHHFLLEAIGIVKEVYPQVKVRIPGSTRLNRHGSKERCKYTDYDHYLNSIIDRFDLTGNVEWMGKMTQMEMARTISRSHVFVMPSAIENHSSSLIEAMCVGIPCVSSFVGGVNDFCVHNKNCLLYRFDDVRSLAHDIISLFSDPARCGHLSEYALMMRERRGENRIKDEFRHIYEAVAKC